MSGNNSYSLDATATLQPQPQQSRRRSPLPLAILAALFIIVPFLSWYGTWFGRKLSDEDVAKYLSDEKNPRHTQHALAQIEQEIERGDANAKKWYPQIVALASSPHTEIRQTAAWVMGQDNKSEEFHAALLKLIEDSEAIVRRNAAVQLARFGDARARPELRAMLRPFDIISPFQGQLVTALTAGTQVKEGTLLARVDEDGKETHELRSPLPGQISAVARENGARVSMGEKIFTITPDPNFVYESLRALYWLGESEDLPDVERYAGSAGEANMPAGVKQQAVLTAKAIQDRATKTR